MVMVRSILQPTSMWLTLRFRPTGWSLFSSPISGPSTSSVGASRSTSTRVAASTANGDDEFFWRYCELYVSSATSGGRRSSKNVVNIGPTGDGGACGKDDTTYC